MKATKLSRETRLNELVETHNLSLSINRLRSAPYDIERWKRALYHALSMSDVGRGQLEKIRIALELP
jgi:hypothetical protein